MKSAESRVGPFRSMARIYRAKSPGFPALLYAGFFAAIPYLVQHFSSMQEASDMMAAKLKPEYLLNTVETFDYIIGERSYKAQNQI
jgi:hypothetical protein